MDGSTRLLFGEAAEQVPARKTNDEKQVVGGCGLVVAVLLLPERDVVGLLHSL
jgi:hypothetical protein